MTESQREIDIALYGATGFVGKLTAQYLAGHPDITSGRARVALAGRSPDKLAAVRDELGETASSWPLITADAGDPASLSDLAARTRVVVTTVGPYAKYGLPLVAACAEHGADYADLTGEPNFILASMDGFHKQAIDTGARIVHSCGFDSIPSDLTVFSLYRRAQADDAGDLLDTDMVVRSMAGGASGGTLASAVEMMDACSADPELRRALADPYTLSPDRSVEPEFGAEPDVRWRRGATIAPELSGYWTGAFFMAMPNSRVVRRSNALLGHAYGARFTYSEQLSLGKSVAAPLAAAVVSGVQGASMSLGVRFFDKLPRPLVEKVLPKPGTGPSEKTRESGHYTVQTYTTTSHGARYRATMAQQGDPGYKATSVLLGESGLTLALDRDALSELRGVLTPASAMGDALAARLPAAGVRFEVERLH